MPGGAAGEGGGEVKEKISHNTYRSSILEEFRTWWLRSKRIFENGGFKLLGKQMSFLFSLYEDCIDLCGSSCNLVAFSLFR